MRICKKCNSSIEGERCIPCRKAYTKALSAKRYIEKKDAIKLQNKLWVSLNPEKVKEKYARYAARNPEKVKIKNARWTKNNREKCILKTQARRALKISSGGNLSKGLISKLMILQRGMCTCGCGQKLGDKFHMDHIIPLSRGGQHTDYNIQLLRSTCNQKKKDKNPIDFMQERGFLL